MKKIILMSSLLVVSLSYGSYVSIIGNSNYKVSDETIMSDWATSGSPYNCLNIVDKDDYYRNVTFDQTQNCDQDEKRTIVKKKNGNVISETTEKKTITISSKTIEVGTHIESNCKSILDNGYSSGDGIYPIKYGINDWNVMCNMTDDGGGWTLVLKKNNGVAIDPTELWKSESIAGVSMPQYEEYYANDPLIINDKSIKNKDYALPIRMDIASFNEVRLEINKMNTTKQYIKFSAGNDYKNFITQSSIISSSWTDIKTEVTNFFSVDGHITLSRRFFLSHQYGGCAADTGWLVGFGVKRPTSCGWEDRDYNLRYSPNSTKILFDQAEDADNIMIYYR